MKRFPLYFVALLSYLYASVSFANEIKINFASVNINDARKQAGSEGKLLFIGFHGVALANGWTKLLSKTRR